MYNLGSSIVENGCEHKLDAGTFTMTAIVVVNALGDIFDHETGEKLAGLKSADRTEYISCEDALYQFMAPRDMFTGNTTIGADRKSVV